jgi:hypothetical protein
MSILSRLFGDASPPEPTLELTDGSEEGLADCAFAVHWRGQVIRARAKYRGAVVGFDVDWPRQWEEVDFGPDVPITGFQATLTLRSCGSASDRFVEALVERFELTKGVAPMMPAVSCTGITLEGDPRLAREQDVLVKLFFFEHDEDRYAEAYLNIVDSGWRLEFNEKDEDYRRNVVAVLTRP